MAKSKDSIGNTLIVAISVSLVCSVLVASAAVILKPRQLQNEEEFRQRIIVDVAGFDLASADPCISDDDYRADTDVLVVRHADAVPEAPQAGVVQIQSDIARSRLF